MEPKILRYPLIPHDSKLDTNSRAAKYGSWHWKVYSQTLIAGTLDKVRRNFKTVFTGSDRSEVPSVESALESYLCTCMSCMEVTSIHCSTVYGGDLYTSQYSVWRWPLYIPVQCMEVTSIHPSTVYGGDLYTSQYSVWRWPIYIQVQCMEMTYIHPSTVYGDDLYTSKYSVCSDLYTSKYSVCSDLYTSQYSVWRWPLYIPVQCMEVTSIHPSTVYGGDLYTSQYSVWRWPIYIQVQCMEMTYIHPSTVYGDDLYTSKYSVCSDLYTSKYSVCSDLYTSQYSVWRWPLYIPVQCM